MDWRSLFKPAVESRGRKSSTEDKAAQSRDECRDLEPLLSLHNDGMASTAETRRVEAHLDRCESCRRAYFWMQATNEVLSNRPAVVPPAGMSSRIKAAVAAEALRERQPVRTRFVLRPAYAIAASILIAAIAWLPGQFSRTAQNGGGIKVAKTTPPAVPTMPPSPVAPALVAPTTPKATRTASAHNSGAGVKHELIHPRANSTVMARNPQPQPRNIERPSRREPPVAIHPAVHRLLIEAKYTAPKTASPIRRQPVNHLSPIMEAHVPAVPSSPQPTATAPAVVNQLQPDTHVATTQTEPDRSTDLALPGRDNVVAFAPAVRVVTDGVHLNLMSQIRSHVKLRGTEQIGSRFGKLSRVTMSTLHEDEPTDSAGSKYGYADMGSSF